METNTESLSGLEKTELIKTLNLKYHSLSPKQRIEEVYTDFKSDEIMLTSSFAATSAFLLKLFSEVSPSQKVYFIDTGYHFNETHIYKNYLTALYGLNVVDVKAEKWKHDFTLEDKTWGKDANMCCSINKVEPLENLRKDYKIWVSGLMAWQSDHRSSLDIFEDRNGIIKFYPLLDVPKEKRDGYIAEHHLPFHPLISKGYHSIGCKHCTLPGKDRNGRWNNNPKTECGLHL